MRASILIPAHDESAVIGRLLTELAPRAARGEWQVVVVCNGCSDDTAAIARGFSGVDVIELDEGSKPAALNVADAFAVAWPRIYLDADIGVRAGSVLDLTNRLAAESAPLAGRPPYRYDTEGASILVRAFYRARSRVPSTNEHLWGAGIYALNELAHRRFDCFPAITADDLFVDSLFSTAEKAIIGGDPVTVRTPRTTKALLNILRRTYRGNAELQSARHTSVSPQSSFETLRELVSASWRLAAMADAAVYVALVGWARVTGRRRQAWERDESSRVAPGGPSDTNMGVHT